MVRYLGWLLSACLLLVACSPGAATPTPGGPASASPTPAAVASPAASPASAPAASPAGASSPVASPAAASPVAVTSPVGSPVVAASPAGSPAAGGAAGPAASTSPSPAAGGVASPTAAASPVTAAPSGPLATVRVGYLPILNYAPLFLALEKGYYREQGLDVQLTPLAGGADMLIQTASGQFDIGAGGVGSALFNAFQRGVPVRVVAPLHAESKPMSTPLVARRASVESGAIKDAASLRGKKVAINARGAATEYWLDAALRQKGLTINDIDLQAIPFDQMVAALESGAIEAGMLAEPLATLAERRGITVRLSDDFLDGAQPTAVYYNTDWAGRNPAAAEGFMVAYLRACRDLQGDGWRDTANVAILERQTRVPADVIVAASPPRFEPNGRINLPDWEQQQRFFMAQNQLTYRDPIDVARLVDSRYVDAALQRLGRVGG